MSVCIDPMIYYLHQPFQALSYIQQDFLAKKFPVISHHLLNQFIFFSLALKIFQDETDLILQFDPPVSWTCPSPSQSHCLLMIFVSLLILFLVTKISFMLLLNFLCPNAIFPSCYLFFFFFSSRLGFLEAGNMSVQHHLSSGFVIHGSQSVFSECLFT